MATQQESRELVIKIYLENPLRNQKTIARIAKVGQSTVSDIIKKFKDDLSVEKKQGGGRKKGFVDKRKAEKVVALLEKNPGLSHRKVAKKMNCSEGLVRKIKKDAGLKTYKVQNIPDRNALKNSEAQCRAKKLGQEFLQKFKCCVMDDETYVLSKFAQLPGQEFYSAKERGGVAERFRTKLKSKFPKKFLVWQAICSCGQRSASFVTSGTINSDIYVKECLQKRLLPFIAKHNVSTFFWPDLASCHYSKRSLEWFEAKNVKLVPKMANPPNCPELRPIERYWALVKRELKNTKKEASNIKEFKNKWNNATKKIPETTIRALMERLPEKVNEFCKNQNK